MSDLRIIILGSAAGGGLPQWNCGCPNCVKARAGKIPSRTQSSIAVSANGADWAVINASPDIRSQINATPALHPTGLRDSPIRSVFVTNGDIDHIAGLLTLRERQAFTLFATSEIMSVLDENRIFTALNPDYVKRTRITLENPFELTAGVTATAYPVPGKVPLFMEGEEVATDLEGEQTVGVELSAGAATAHYIPGCAQITDKITSRIGGADALLFDGTVWQNDEMAREGVGEKTGQRMGHIPMMGEHGSITGLSSVSVGQKVFVHMNNTNPVLDPENGERAEAEAAGWVISEDGMELCL
ncbi:MAG: pyrroloquinoline quinone biosynthesis protein PqqB [Pseudomonadota bacterium]